MCAPVRADTRRGDEDAKMNGAVNHVGEKKKSTNKRRTEREKGLK